MGNSCLTSNKKINVNRGMNIDTDNVEIRFESYLSKIVKKQRNIIINWEAKNKTEKYHWWPMLNKRNNDYINNLYAKGGGLYKYDILFGTNSIEIQKRHYMINSDSTRTDKNWAGFCNNASVLSCLYEYPKYPVIVLHNKKEIKFHPRDIESLMIVCSDNAVQKRLTLFFGERNDEFIGDDESEPYPSQFLKMLKIMCCDEEPFIMDIDSGVSVWNYSFDRVIVEKHTSCSIKNTAPTHGVNEFYNFKIYSQAYPEKNQDLWGYINTKNVPYSLEKSNDKIIKEGWISAKHPDFIWKKFKNESSWSGYSNINSEILSSIVYKIYKQSLIKDKNKLSIQ